jgi:hypothetical protein
MLVGILVDTLQIQHYWRVIYSKHSEVLVLEQNLYFYSTLKLLFHVIAVSGIMQVNVSY